MAHRHAAFRTVRAVFPHTALQSVVSSSRLPRSLPSRMKCEQSGIREEGIGPALMIGSTETEPRALLLLAQEGPEPATNEAVEDVESAVMRLLEVAEPAAQDRVEIADRSGEADPSRADGFRPDAILQLVHALLAHVSPAGFEPVAVVDRGRDGSSPPRPPNRAGGFPAHGSPVGGFLIGAVPQMGRRYKERTPTSAKVSLDAVASADSMRSSQTQAATHDQLPPVVEVFAAV